MLESCKMGNIELSWQTDDLTVNRYVHLEIKRTL